MQAPNLDAESFDDSAAALNDFAVALYSAVSRKTEPSRADRNVTGVLSTIVVALADARGRTPGDGRILDDVDRAHASWQAANASSTGPFASLGPALVRMRELALQKASRSAPPTPTRVVSPFIASRGLPALHRDVHLEAAPTIAPVRAFGTLPPRRPSASPPVTLPQKTLRRWARDALEELAIGGRLRRPRPDEPWSFGEGFERRTLVSLDAIASLGRGASNDERVDLAAVIDDWLLESTISDPGRTFAAAFVLACLDGHGAAARLNIHARTNDPNLSEAVEDALALGSSPYVDDVVISLLCEDDKSDLLERGLHVARRRKRVPTALVLELLQHPTPSVAIAAARACSLLDRESALAPLENALFGADEVALQAAESLALLGAWSPRCSQRILALAKGDPHSSQTIHAARLAVLQAQSRDVNSFLELCAIFHPVATLDLLGWLGNAHALPTLLAALEHADPALRKAASWSLMRITGAGREELGQARQDLAPDAADVTNEEALEARHPPLDPAYWVEPCSRARQVDAARLRFGRPIELATILGELGDPLTYQGFRKTLVTEFALYLQNAGYRDARAIQPLDIDGWIVSQEQWLEQARERFGRSGARL